jgi:X-X-X-Leu-X-X-Gly heptad repeat protein
MGRSVADTPTSPEFIRISDEDRERAVDDLKREFVDGRLSHETFMLRVQVALGARNSGQLAGLLDDLPPRRPRLAQARTAARRLARNARTAVTDGAAAVADGAAAMADGASALAAPLREALSPRREPPRREPPLPAPTRPGAPPAPFVFPAGEGTSFTIGRHQGCDLFIADMTVSRLHARLARVTEGWLLIDLGSTNGTRLNGWRVRDAVPIRPGDQVRFGSAEFVVQADQTA